ncbi:MAG: NAD(P)H-quinone oxidoreductase [Chloroflexi bacterium]|nr:NAD(P)H-quinone oxidoreductase [Chloroflexota bacterium]
MRAVVITRPGGPEVLEVQELPVPEPGPEQVRVRVRAAGLNRADINQRHGRYPAPPGSLANVPGLEFAGEVEAVGPGVQGTRLGQRVYGIIGGGGQAERVVVHERMVVPIPERLDTIAAAGVPEVFITAHDGLFTQAGLTLGESVLIHAVGSGVGTAAVQLARVAGARSFGTSRTPAKLERARELGLDVALAAEGFAQAVQAETDGRGVNVVLDSVGGPYLAGNLAALAMKGRVVVLAAMGGSSEPLPFGLLQGKRARLMGTLLRGRPLEEKILATQLFAAQVNPLLAAGALRPIIDRVFPLADVRAAYAYLESNQSFGKVILAMS